MQPMRADEVRVSLMLTFLCLFLYLSFSGNTDLKGHYTPSPPPCTVSLPSRQCQVSYFCIRGGEISVCVSKLTANALPTVCV